MKKTKMVITIIIATILISVVSFGLRGNGNKYPTLQGLNEVTIYKSSQCGCCSLYVQHMKSKGKTPVKIVDI